MELMLVDTYTRQQYGKVVVPDTQALAGARVDALVHQAGYAGVYRATVGKGKSLGAALVVWAFLPKAAPDAAPARLAYARTSRRVHLASTPSTPSPAQKAIPVTALTPAQKRARTLLLRSGLHVHITK